jgi:holin-like protein
MKILGQFGWIFFFSLLGVGLSLVLPLPIPGSVLGMILLFLALHFNWLKMEAVEVVGDWLVHNMAILFVPAGVGLMTNFGLLSSIWWQLLIIVIVSTCIMILSVGKIVEWVAHKNVGGDS